MTADRINQIKRVAAILGGIGASLLALSFAIKGDLQQTAAMLATALAAFGVNLPAPPSPPAP